MRRELMTLGLCAFCGIPAHSASNASNSPEFRPDPKTEISLIVPEGLSERLKGFLAGRKPEAVKDYRGEGAARDVIELLLLMQALRRAGWQGEIQLSPIASYARQKSELAEGQAFAAGTFYWLDDLGELDPQVSKHGLLDDGHFVVGLYALASNARALQARKLADVRRLTAVTSEAWTHDHQALKALGLAGIHTTVTWPSMLRMLEAGRADFTFLPFTGQPDMSLTTPGHSKLLPIPGLKVVLPGARGAVWAKRHPAYAEWQPRMRQALDAMLRDGTVQRAFTQAGYLDDARVRHWTPLKIGASTSP